MTYPLSAKQVVLIFLAVIMILAACKLITHHFDPTTFITAGTDFTDPAKTLTPIAVQPRQGYDGQFFYRYALNPTGFQQYDNGVHVDHPAYRIQRIAYPAIAWLLSLGGEPALVPIVMILVNILAFLGIAFYSIRFTTVVNGDSTQSLLPLLLCGIYMSFSRDLAEVVELCFFTGAVYYMFRQRYAMFALFATLTLFSRETSMLSLLPLTAGLTLQAVRRRQQPASVILFIIPFIAFAVWKYVIYTHIPSSADAAAGYGSVGAPFMGIINGLKDNLIFTDAQHVFQLLFWLMYMCWQVAFVVIVFRKVSFRQLLAADQLSLLKLAYLSWLFFAIIFSDNIYGDDWGFVRVFSQWNMIGFLLLIGCKQRTPRLFNILSAGMVVLTIARLIIRI